MTTRRSPLRLAAVLGAAALVAACAAAPSEPGAEALPVRQSPGATHTHTPGTAPHGHGTASAEGPATPTGVPVAPVALRPGERRVTLHLPGGPYRPSAPGAGRDDYRCFLIDPGLTEDTFVTGSDVLPGNSAVVHHAILFAVPPGQVAAAQRQDADAAGDGWSCFGGSALQQSGDDPVRNLDRAPWLAAWAPGGGETVMHQRTGRFLPAGSQVVLQLHYNLRAAGDDASTFADDTAVSLRLTPGTADLRPLRTMLLVAPVELPCTSEESGRRCDRSAALVDLASRIGPSAGRTVGGLALLCSRAGRPIEPGTRQSCDRRAPQDMVVRAVAGHMHLLGRSISVDLDPGTSREQRLLDRKVWDFDDQAATPLDQPVRVRAGDTLRVTCTHDAGLRSMLPELADEQPRYATWGEGTSDEMCLGIVQYTDS